MIRSSFSMRAVLFTAALGIAACGTPMTTDGGPDGTGPGDAADVVGPPGDGGDTGMPTDVRTDGGDGGASTTCNMVMVEDLNALGMVTGDTLRYTSNNMMAADSLTTGLQPRSQPACPFLVTRQRVFRYRMRGGAALRVSTSNPGTTRGFDTVLVIADGARACSSSTRPFACNDDDRLFGGDARVLTSTATTNIRAMGTDVLIGLGGFVGPMMQRNPPGEQGTFELSVQELMPQATGMPCDVRGVNSICAADATCVGNTTRFSAMGTCRANGSVAGAQCATGDVCTGALMCDTTDMPPRCYSVVGTGMPCERFTNGASRCMDGFTCVSTTRGAVVGTCAANGSAVYSQCDAMNACAAGLSCVPSATGGPGTCLTSAAAGAVCSTFDTRCPTGQSCLSGSFTGTAGMCTADGTVAGTACTMAGMCSGAGLMCGMAPNLFCTANANVGETCNPRATCATNSSCRLGVGTGGAGGTFDVYQGSCVTDGAAGGRCRVTAPNCDGTLMCSNMTDPANGACTATLAAGAPCVYGINGCGMDLTCVHTPGMGGTVGTCVANGTQAGAGCRTAGSMMQCDSGLSCSNTATGEGRCQTAAPMGGACDARYATNRCPMGQVCRATGLDTGTCAAATTEMEPNDRTSGGTPMALPIAIQGDLDAYDVDCVPVTVPMSARLYARASSPAGLCPFAPAPYTLDWQISVYDSTGRLLGGDNNNNGFGCPRVDGNDPSMRYPWAVNSGAATTWYVCIHNADATGRGTGTPAPYVLSVGAM